MREIKFRAWDKKKGRMLTHDHLFALDCSNEFPFLPLLKNMYSHSLRSLDVEIMQYTGQKDAEGKEIYESDIVQVTGGEFCQGFYETNETCVVKWFGTGFDLVYKSKHGDYEVGMGWGFALNDVKITKIGNVYENSDLLKEGPT